MNEIQQWLNDRSRDYDTGVNLYRNSPVCKTRTLQILEKGKSQRNLAVLLGELRKIKNQAVRQEKIQPKPEAVKKAVQKVKKEIKPDPKQDKFEKKAAINSSSQKQFKSVRMGDLPKELRPRFKRQKNLFYEMCELKLEMNESPPEKNTLDIQLAIEALDQEIDLIWKEIDHWMNYKTILPGKTDTDFSKIPPQKLYLKKANIQSNINKVQKRIDRMKEEYTKEPNRQERVKIKTALNKSLKTLHKNQLNLNQINELLT